ncbi:hypothetical protein ACQEV2_40925 [Streptomyces sp. CA-251387]|uniref:hypothetical protein n=1 Tax=Streptomyces sp. CA-251387 TaxID=3240064 RepID=UPI003D90749B
MDQVSEALIAGVASLIGALAGALVGSKATIRAARISARTEVAKSRYETRHPAYQALTTSLNQLRHSLEANDADFELAAFEAADQRVHDNIVEVSREGPREVAEIAQDMGWECYELKKEVRNGQLNSRAARINAWQTRIVPWRDDLDEAMQQHGI